MQIGNAVINDETDTKGLIDYFASHALISPESSRKLHEDCKFPSDAETSDGCNDIVTKLRTIAGNIDIYSIYYPLCLDGNLTSIPKMFSVSIPLILALADSMDTFDTCFKLMTLFLGMIDDIIHQLHQKNFVGFIAKTPITMSLKFFNKIPRLSFSSQTKHHHRST